MLGERWKKIEDLYHAALGQPTEKRGEFLLQACPGDPQLRKEVESLLDQPDGFLESAPMLAVLALRAGAQLGNFEIIELLGRGGMGEVYKAIDKRLNRLVAIKVSAARFSERFEREARAIAALNHPHVCILYDVGPDYLVMEYVEGATLARLMRDRRLPVKEVLQYALQIAGAMEAAHAAGIVHRDLKPGNVMVTGAGLAKVLDFGLAKIAQSLIARGEAQLTATITSDAAYTGTGMALGTPAYMSPEQALGKALDARSDVFSFGLLLYEMLIGQQAFRGDSTLEVVSGIIHLEVPPPSAANPDVGSSLDSLVAGCLRKDPAQRIQSMAEVRRQIEDIAAGSSAEISRKWKPSPTPERHWMRWASLVIALLALAAVALFGWRKFQSIAPDSSEAPEMVRVTSDAGLSIDPTISQDGKLVAYASDRSGEKNLDIWVKQIGGGDPIRLTRDPADDVQPNFSPDGTHIAFRSERDGGGIYIVPTTGGQERRIADGGRAPQYSPDGTKVLYWTGTPYPPPIREGKLFVFGLDTNTMRRIRPDFALAAHPIWSPDGSRILFIGEKDSAGGNYDLWTAPLDTGPAMMSYTIPLGDLFDPFAWRGDQVYFAWNGEDLQTISRLRVDPMTGRASGKPRRLSAVTTTANSPSISRTGQVVFSVGDDALNCYRIALDANTGTNSGRPELLSQGPGWNVVESISADGRRLTFTAQGANGNPQVWTKDLETGRERALTERGMPKSKPEISRDGRFVAWTESLTRGEGFAAPFAGGPVRQLCTDCGPIRAWSLDGKFLLYDQRGARSAIGLMEFASGTTSTYLQSKDYDFFARSISSDGKWIAFTAHRTRPDFKVYVAPFVAGRPPQQNEWVEAISSSEVDPNPTWSPDGGLLYFSSEQDGHKCIWALRLNRLTKRPVGKLFPVQHFHTPSLLLAGSSYGYPAIVLAPDKMLLSLEERSAGIWMLQVPDSK
jgi:serine/threonine protein kinase